MWKEGDGTTAVSSHDHDTEIQKLSVLLDTWHVWIFSCSKHIYMSTKDALSAPPSWSRRLLATTAAAFSAMACVREHLPFSRAKYRPRTAHENSLSGLINIDLFASPSFLCALPEKSQIAFSSKVKVLSRMHVAICLFDGHVPPCAQLYQEQHVGGFKLKLVEMLLSEQVQCSCDWFFFW